MQINMEEIRCPIEKQIIYQSCEYEYWDVFERGQNGRLWGYRQEMNRRLEHELKYWMKDCLVGDKIRVFIMQRFFEQEKQEMSKVYHKMGYVIYNIHFPQDINAIELEKYKNIIKSEIEKNANLTEFIMKRITNIKITKTEQEMKHHLIKNMEDIIEKNQWPTIPTKTTLELML